MKYTSFMFVEDGSVDTEHLISDLKEHNPEIKVVIYRQGSTMPTLISPEEKIDSGKSSAVGFCLEEEKENDRSAD